KVPALEGIPFRRLVAEPLTELGAGRYVLDPSIELGGLFGETARPNPVDEHAATVRASRRVVDAFDLEFGSSRAGHGAPRRGHRGQAANGRRRRRRASRQRPRSPPSALPVSHPRGWLLGYGRECNTGIGSRARRPPR